MSPDLTRLSAVALGGQIAAGEVSAVEVAQAHLDRIAVVDGDVHAFLHVSTESAAQELPWDDPDVRRFVSTFTVTTLGQYFMHDIVHHLHDVRA